VKLAREKVVEAQTHHAQSTTLGKCKAAELELEKVEEALDELGKKRVGRSGSAKSQHNAAVERAQQAVEAAHEKVVEAQTHHAKVYEKHKVRVRAS
jgi:hypothetical protein